MYLLQEPVFMLEHLGGIFCLFCRNDSTSPI